MAARKIRVDPETVGEIVQLSDQRLRWVVVLPLVLLFIVLNVFVAKIVLELLAVESEHIGMMLKLVAEGKAPKELVAEYPRVLSSGVIISLVGGTVVQTGAAMYAIARNLFPGRG